MVTGKVAKPTGARPDYWEEACAHLVRKDRVMKRLIPKFGDACLQSRGDAFTTLARSIVGQQISVASAQAAWRRWTASACSSHPRRSQISRTVVATEARCPVSSRTGGAPCWCSMARSSLGMSPSAAGQGAGLR